MKTLKIIGLGLLLVVFNLAMILVDKYLGDTPGHSFAIVITACIFNLFTIIHFAIKIYPS